ncbi:MAG: IclR family transcriptional regulator, partial [Chloroflexi bacterium]|nr:IclR family transcriptional regulator [Chloroflexota bacterium]
SRALGLHKATTYRLLQTLRARGLVEQDAITGNYRLGLHLYELGIRVIAPADLVYVARDDLRDLALHTGESATVAVLNGRHAVTILKAEGSQVGGVAQVLGRAQQAHGTANGKVLLAHLPPEQLEARLAEVELEQFTPRTITDFRRLCDHLAQVRRQGYALDCEETTQGVNCAAAPIRDLSGLVVAAIGVSGSTARLDWTHSLHTVQEVVATADRISRRLGYLPHLDPLTRG